MTGSTPETHPYSEAESRPYTDFSGPPIVDLDKLQQQKHQGEPETEVRGAAPDGPKPQDDRTLHADPELYGNGFIPPYQLRRLARQRELGERAEQRTPAIHPETVRLAIEVISSPRLHSYLRNRIGRTGSRTATAKDIAQEVVTVVLAKYAKAPPEEDDIWPFVFGVAAHKVADHYRHTNRRKEDPMEDIPDIVTARSAADVFWEKWDRQRVREVMAELATTDAKRSTLLALLMDNLSAEDKGKILGTSADTARVRGHRLRAELRKKLEHQFGGQEIAFGYFVPPQQGAPPERASQKKKSAPQVRMSEVRNIAGEALYAACAERVAQGEPELSAHIPVYLGAWSTALFALDRLRDTETPRPSAVIFPHERLLPAFHNFIEARLGQTASYFIQTPETIANWLGGHSLEHVVAPGSIDEGLKERLRAHSSFILWLLDKNPPETETAPTDDIFCAPLYRSVGGRSTIWEHDDSVRYLQEWRFATGNEMTRTTAQRLGKQGSPTLSRLTKSASYDKLAAEAGYPPTPKAE